MSPVPGVVPGTEWVFSKGVFAEYVTIRYVKKKKKRTARKYIFFQLGRIKEEVAFEG